MGHYFELLATRRYNIVEESDKLSTLFTGQRVHFINGVSYTIHEYVDKNLFKTWKYSDTFISVNDLLNKFSIYPAQIIKLEQYFLYAEIIYNLTMLCGQYYLVKSMSDVQAQTQKILRNIEIVVGHFNHELFRDEDKYIIIEKNAAASRAADIVDTESAKRIFEYNHFLLRGQVSKKAEILAQLAKTIEHYHSALDAAGYKNIYSDTTFLLNTLNIRHAIIKEPEKTFVGSKKPAEMEKLYDDAYDLILTCIVLYNSIKVRKSAADIRKEFAK